MSLERIFKMLLSLGLSESDSKVYLIISSKGPMTAKQIFEEMKINKQQLYPILRKLKHKKILNIIDTHPSLFSAVPFELVLELLITSKIEKSKKILKNKKELMSNWDAASWNNDS